MAKSKKSASVAPVTLTPDMVLTPPTQDIPMVPAIPVPVETYSAPVDQVQQRLDDVLGTGGEVSHNPKSTGGGGKFNLSFAIKSALDTNVDMSRDNVLTFIEDTYGKHLTVDFPDGTFTNTLSVVRKKLKNQDIAVAKDEAGIDPVTVLRLCQTLHMTPTALLLVIGTLQATGTYDAICGGLAKLAELQALMSEQK